MMFYKKQIKGQFRVTVQRLKDYMNQGSISEENKIRFLSDHLKKQFASFYNSSCGVYLGIKKVQVLTMKEDSSNYFFINTSFKAQVYFYKVKIKELIDLKITKISPTFIEGQVYTAKVQIPKSEISNSLPVYIPATNCFEIGNKEKLREGDYLRAKVTSVVSESLKNYKYPLYKIKASCKNLGTGKIVFKP